MVNDGASMNICNPQMIHCFFCHLTQLELLNAQGKHKGLVSYNKNCCNPNLGLKTNAKACKVVGQEEARESHLMLPGVQKSVRE